MPYNQHDVRTPGEIKSELRIWQALLERAVNQDWKPWEVPIQMSECLTVLRVLGWCRKTRDSIL